MMRHARGEGMEEIRGLTKEQVESRIREGKVNLSPKPVVKSYRQIVEHTFNLFNAYNFCIALALVAVKAWTSLFFVVIVSSNAFLRIYQEIKSRNMVAKLNLIISPKTTVVREGEKQEIRNEEIVLDDVIYLKSGMQIASDCVVLDTPVEVDESLLSGEADPVLKQPGDHLLSGSFLLSGACHARVEHVGADNYAACIANEARKRKPVTSEMVRVFSRVTRMTSFLVVPLSALMLFEALVLREQPIETTVVNTSTALLGMLPVGLVLLASISMMASVVRLGHKNVVVQEMFSIETLSHADTLCLDKTGTITEGTMKVEDVQLYDTAQTTVVQHTAKFDPETGEPVQNVSALKPEVTVSAEKENGQIQETVNLETVSQEERQKLQEIDHIMGNMMSVLHDQNATADALRKRFPSRNDLKLIHAIPFSSDRKYSGAVFEGRGTYLMGAAQFLFPEGNEELLEHCSSYAQEGYRILVLAHSEQETKGTERPTGLEPLGLFLITDVIREEAPDTLAFFDSQGVDLKVISGDDPVTVSAIAKKAGLKNANHYIDATTIKTSEEMQRAVAECSVFGRVTPQQKKQMVQALQSQKHTVAMTGDGVNDVLALKEADCSIAMAAGSDAAKNIANVVLLDSNFGAMPHIVNQGRRVVNNIRSAASMFLIKTIFSVLLSLITIFFGDAYPFEPIQMSLISACAVGIPTFLLTQENNYNKIDHTFLRHVFMNAFPAAVTITGCVFTIMLVCQDVYHSNVMLNTACVLVTGWNYMSALRTVYSPLNTYRKVIIHGMQFAFFISAVVLQDLLTLGSLEFGMIILVFVLMTFSPILIETITEWIRRIYEKSLDREDENKGFFARFLERVQK